MTDHPAPTYCTCETFQRALMSTLLYPPEMNTTRCLTCGLSAQPPPHPVSHVLVAETNNWDYVAPAERPDVEAILARADAATPGPWTHRVTPDFSEISAASHINLALVGSQVEDAEFIAHARQDIPALLLYVARLEAEAGR